jgi:hypothetical protein
MVEARTRELTLTGLRVTEVKSTGRLISVTDLEMFNMQYSLFSIISN